MEIQLQLKQKPVLSQRMQLSAKILQMNHFDLEQYIQECALENPLIELDMPAEDDTPDLRRAKKLEWLDSLDNRNSYRHITRPEDHEHNIPLYEKTATVSLTDLLIAQLPDFKLSEEAEGHVRYLIESLDENGYMPVSREQLRQSLRVNDKQLEDAFRVLLSMEPAGVGGADLRDCLLIQAKKKSPFFSCAHRAYPKPSGHHRKKPAPKACEGAGRFD